MDIIPRVKHTNKCREKSVFQTATSPLPKGALLHAPGFANATVQRRPRCGPSGATGCQTPTPWFSTLTFHGILPGGLLPELLGEPDENSFRTPDVAEPVDVFVIDDFINHRRTELTEPGEGVVDVLDCEHDAQVSQ
jgi:hypothetical protein